MSIDSELRHLAAHYDGLASEYGDAPETAHWSTRASQARRFAILAQVVESQTAKILDAGCGTGALLDFLSEERGFEGEYVGIDLAEGPLAVARKKYPTARFERRNLLDDTWAEQFDYVLASGTFNNRLSANWEYMAKGLAALYGHTGRALAFNALSTYVDWMEDDLWYVDPERVFEYCKTHLTPRVAIRHDYEVKPGVVPYEFSIYAYRTQQTPRVRLRS